MIVPFTQLSRLFKKSHQKNTFFTFKTLHNKVKILSKETSAFEIEIELIKKLIKF